MSSVLRRVLFVAAACAATDAAANAHGGQATSRPQVRNEPKQATTPSHVPADRGAPKVATPEHKAADDGTRRTEGQELARSSKATSKSTTPPSAARALTAKIAKATRVATHMSGALDRYKEFAAEARSYTASRKKAEKAKASAAHELYNATVQLHAAKGSHLAATRRDMHLDPFSAVEAVRQSLSKMLGNSEKHVAAAQRRLEGADKRVRAADKQLRKAGHKADHALAVQSRIEKKLDDSHNTTQELVAAITNERKDLDREADQVMTSAAGLKKEFEALSGLNTPKHTGRGARSYDSRQSQKHGGRHSHSHPAHESTATSHRARPQRS